MVKARTLILRGLLEVLVLDALYREPRHGYGLIRELEDAVGALPGKNQIYPLLARLEAEGLIESKEEVGEGGRPRLVYSLTHRGEKRLTEFKALPPPFRDRLVGLWAHGHPAAPAASDMAEPGPPASATEGPAPPTPSPPAAGLPSPAPDAWVSRLLAQLPPGAQIRCPHAEVEVRREPATGGWTIRTTRAQVGTHPGTDECALCFVIRAATRLLVGA